MKLKYLFVAIVMTLIYTSCKKESEDYDFNLPPDITDLTVSKGDTSVFLKWKAEASAHSYLIVRGKNVIAENLHEPYYEDDLAPDTLVEYRVYAVNKENWRSYTYASDSGYVSIPNGTLPRPPQFTASKDDYKYCTLSWTNGRFALSYKIYKNGVLIGDEITGNTYIDKSASPVPADYKIYSVNGNGISAEYSQAMGVKSYFFINTFEDDAVGFEYEPYTFRAPTVGFYTEGLPKVVDTDRFAGSKSLQVVDGKIQLLCDWGGVAEKGIYRISLMVKKSEGGFWMVPNFSGAEHLAATGQWTKFEIETPLLNKSETFNLKVEPYGAGPTLIDNWSIEYVAPQ